MGNYLFIREDISSNSINKIGDFGCDAIFNNARYLTNLVELNFHSNKIYQKNRK